MRSIRLFVMSALAMLLACSGLRAANPSMPSDKKVVVAYVTSWSREMPDPKYMTHINYAFGHVSDTFDGVRINNEDRLRQMVALKKQNPELKVLLSIGGWGSGRFSEMAADDKLRQSFARDCRRVVKEFELDGIDIDWEYPTSNAGGISASPADTDKFTLLMRDIRQAIGKKKQLTLASVASADYIDFPAIMSYVDFVNIMSYDMGTAPKHHAALYPSENSGRMTASTAVEAHLQAGVPASKLVMGMPFYGRGGKDYPNFQDFNKIDFAKGYRECWDETAKVPYLIDKNGTFVFGYENPRSLAIKCQYILKKELLGGMYWDYSGDNEQGDMRRTVYEGLIERKPFHDL